MATIVLDPGHGGDKDVAFSTSNNAVGPAGTLEKTLTLDVALRLCPILQAAGHRVLLTRDSDVNVTAAERARVARDNKAEIFVSIHFNAFRDPSVQGTETLVRPTGTSDGLAGVDPASLALARDVQAELVATLGLRDRGLKPGKWVVLSDKLHDAATARCLAECSFLTDPAEEARLADPAYRDRIANALATAVAHYAATRAQPVQQAQAFARSAGGTRQRSTTTNGVHARNGRAVFGAVHPTSQVFGRRDPDAYGYAEAIDDEGEGAENDTGAALATAQGDSDYTDEGFPENYADSAESEHFSLSEFRCHDGTDCPERFRGHVQVLMDNLEVLRAELGHAPIHVNSGYRTPSYNKKIGGAKRSKHVCGMAADFTVEGHDLQYIFDTIEALIAAGRMRQGGLSLYKTFVHYDVRGVKARWPGG
jgi:N-acetylmuramoyl-L-alanine amidase